MKSLYQKGTVTQSIKKYFSVYIELLTKPSGEKIFTLLLAIIVLQEVRSIRFLYQWFMKKVNDTYLNSYYYLLGSKLPLDMFSRLTIRIALSCISDSLKSQPIFLSIDDTLVEKYGVHFACYQKMFDHAAHNGSNYLNGHCFVCLTLHIPVWVGKTIRYLCISVGYRLRQKGENKLKIAASMTKNAMQELTDISQVILLVDSWYPKGAVKNLIPQYENLDLIANVRVDTNIFDLPPKPTGKRGRPRTKGKPLDIHTDFHMDKVGDYFVGARSALTNLFKNVVHVTVTASNPDNFNTYRVFISTVLPNEIFMNLAQQEKKRLNQLNDNGLWLLPLHLYSFRWDIEVVLYQHKTFWALGQYMIRSKDAIDNYVNFIALAYSCVQMIPFCDANFSVLKDESPQVQKYCISEAIQREVFFYSFVDSSQNAFNSFDVINAFNALTLFNFIS